MHMGECKGGAIVRPFCAVAVELTEILCVLPKARPVLLCVVAAGAAHTTVTAGCRFAKDGALWTRVTDAPR